MIEKTLYPPTVRIDHPRYQVTEKLDGSNIGFFKLDNELIIATRNYIFTLKELEEVKDMLYKGLYQFLKNNGETLLNKIYDNGSGFFAEWIGQGHICYGNTLDKKVYIFAKANIMGSYKEETLEIYNLFFDRDLLIYPFKEQTIPSFIGQPELVATLPVVTIEKLDELYDEYLAKVNRRVEGFVIMSQSGAVTKYVRYKDGKFGKHRLPKK